MPTSQPFQLFKRRFARAYFVLALFVILLVAIATTYVALVTIVNSTNDSVNTTASRVRDKVRASVDKHQAIGTYAQNLVASESRPHVRIIVLDRTRNVLAGSRPRPGSTSVALATLVGLQRVTIDTPDGIVSVVSDYDWFDELLERLLLVMLAAAVVGAVIAGWLGRRITSGAVAPLIAVTNALNDIADGNFVPQPVIEQNEQLQDLTTAYNNVAFTLRSATAERERNEMQMRQFIADAGHELRTPLTVVMGYLDALRTGVVRDPDGINRIYETIAGESRRMKVVIERLIFLARLDRESQIVPIAVDIAKLVDDVVGRLQNVGGERLVYRRNGSIAVLADPAELTEGIKNVVDNALKYAPSSNVEVTVETDGGVAIVQIADRGPGMNSDDLEHAFDRFYRGEARIDADGSGLGLAITKRAVERAGGAIDLQSQVGRGTTVTITLPVAVEA